MYHVYYRKTKKKKHAKALFTRALCGKKLHYRNKIIKFIV
jgi:hypothetical protein